ncbi:MAG: chemotaxis protein CheB [Flavipsychrobacter sp.]
MGIVLSGALDDGTAGLWAVKQCGGIAIVQDPLDAEVPSMPQNAMNAVTADYVVPIAEMAALLTKLVNKPVAAHNGLNIDQEKRTRAEVCIAMEDKGLKNNIFSYGELTPYTCPECHGVLTALKEGRRIRFRCHTGHAFSADSLLAAITEDIEETLWTAVRSVQESILLLNHMGDHFAEANQPQVAALYFKKAQDAGKRADLVREAVFSHEQLSTEKYKRRGQQGRNLIVFQSCHIVLTCG